VMSAYAATKTSTTNAQYTSSAFILNDGLTRVLSVHWFGAGGSQSGASRRRGEKGAEQPLWKSLVRAWCGRVRGAPLVAPAMVDASLSLRHSLECAPIT
jgi:hypothetical protein